VGDHPKNNIFGYEPAMAYQFTFVPCFTNSSELFMTPPMDAVSPVALQVVALGLFVRAWSTRRDDQIDTITAGDQGQKQ